MPPPKPYLVYFAVAVSLLTGVQPLFAADAPAPASASATSAGQPAATTPPAAPDAGAPRGNRAGGGAGRGGRGGPMTPEDQAKIAQLANLPIWKPGVGDGDYRLVPDATKTPPYNDLTNPAYAPAPENARREGVAKGRVETFHIPQAGSKFYPPPSGGGRGAPAAPVASGAADAGPMREVNVYIPAGYVAGTPAPLLFCHDAMGMHDNKPAPYLPDILDNLIAAKRLPPMIAVMVMPFPNPQRSQEYDTVSGKFAEYVEAEILPVVEQKYNVKFSKDPDARAVIGGSSGAAAAMSMAWFHTELWHRVHLFSPTFTALRRDPETAPHGAWEFHENFIPKSPVKPLRVWLEVGERDNGATGSDAGMSNWVFASIHTAAVLKAKGYHYQFVYAPEAGHVDRPVRSHTLAPALEWLWQDYKPATK
ncbi:MAG: alpha/beta hydrolase-fold protein [Opitutaceae bacterium]